MKYVCLILICITVFSCDFGGDNSVRKTSYVRDENYEAIASKVESEIAQKLSQEIGLRCIGTGGGMMSNIQRMSMSFQFFHEVDLVEARKLLIYIVAEYLNAVNSSKEVRPYLHNYPFNVENIDIMVWIKKSDGCDVAADKVAFMSCINGILLYGLPLEAGEQFRKDLHEETYEEALKIVKEQEVSSHARAS